MPLTPFQGRNIGVFPYQSTRYLGPTPTESPAGRPEGRRAGPKAEPPTQPSPATGGERFASFWAAERLKVACTHFHDSGLRQYPALVSAETRLEPAPFGKLWANGSVSHSSPSRSGGACRSPFGASALRQAPGQQLPCQSGSIWIGSFKSPRSGSSCLHARERPKK